jgi:DNA mismatch repair protein MutS2
VSPKRLQALLEAYAAQVARTPEGQRHNTLIRYAVAAGGLLPHGLDPREAEEALVAAAMKAGLPERVYLKARGFMDPGGRKLEEILKGLENRILELDQERQELKKAVEEARARLEAIRRREEEVESGLREALDKKKKEAELLIEAAREELSGLIRALKEEKGKVQVITQRRIREIGQELLRHLGAHTIEGKGKKSVKVGDTVVHRSYGQAGRVLELLGDGERVIAQFGSVKAELAIDQLEKVEACTKDALSGGVRWELKTPLMVELNVIGRRVPEAIQMVEKALNRAIIEGREAIRIVHGHGTGQLRRAIRDYLKEFPQVKGIRPEEPQFGGEAITVVEL